MSFGVPEDDRAASSLPEGTGVQLLRRGHVGHYAIVLEYNKGRMREYRVLCLTCMRRGRDRELRLFRSQLQTIAGYQPFKPPTT